MVWGNPHWIWVAPSGSSPGKNGHNRRKIIHFFLLGLYSQSKLFYLVAAVAAANSDDDGGGDDNVGADDDPIADIRTNISRYWSLTE